MGGEGGKKKILQSSNGEACGNLEVLEGGKKTGDSHAKKRCFTAGTTSYSRTCLTISSQVAFDCIAKGPRGERNPICLVWLQERRNQGFRKRKKIKPPEHEVTDLHAVSLHHARSPPLQEEKEQLQALLPPATTSKVLLCHHPWLVRLAEWVGGKKGGRAFIGLRQRRKEEERIGYKNEPLAGRGGEGEGSKWLLRVSEYT